LSDERQYTSGLAEFVDKQIKSWAKQKKEILEPKLQANYDAVTNITDRHKAWKKDEAKGWRSNVWIGFVRVKIWAFYSIFLDTVLKAGKIPFTLEPSPYDENNMDARQLKQRDIRIERMRDKIESQLSMRHADREYMKKWLSGAYYGMGFSKFDIDAIPNVYFKQVDMSLGDAAQYMAPEEIEQYTRFEMVTESEDVPGHRYVSIWNMVWDMEGDDLQNSAGYAEHIASCAYDLMQLKGKPGYLDEVIDKIIQDRKNKDRGTGSEGPAESPSKEKLNERKQNYRRYEFYMRAPRKLCEEFEKNIKSKKLDVAYLGTIAEYEDLEAEGDDIEIMGEIVDCDMWVVEQNLDESTGTGIADNMEGVQNSLIGYLRSFEDNKKLSANVTSAVKTRYFNNPSQLDDIIPGKKYDISDSCDDVRKAIMPIVFPDVGDSLLSGINLMMQFKDDVSMVPTIMQGFSLPKHKADTAYELRQMTEMAGKYIGQSIRNNDEQFIEPEIQDIYEYNMIYGEDESIKVNCKVKANGFTSFQNKEIRGLRMKEALALFVSSEILLPYVKIKPHLDIIYESMDEDPDKFIKSDEEMAQEGQKKQQQMAQAQAQAEQKAIQMQAQVKNVETQAAISEEKAENQSDMAENQQLQEFEVIQKNIDLQNELKAIEFEAMLNKLYNPNPEEVTNNGQYQYR
jgi:hypothetical protein